MRAAAGISSSGSAGVSAAQQLFPTEQAHARISDPWTSHEAARVASVNLSATQERIYYLLEMHGPLTDEELIAVFRRICPNSRLTDQNIRSRRADLKNKNLVRAAQSYGVTSHGNRSRKWEAVQGVGRKT